MDERAAGPGEDTEGHAPVGVIRGLFASFLDAAKTRLDLAAVEVEIYLLRTVQLLLWSLAAVVCGLLAVAFGLVALIVALWDTHRMVGLLGGTAGFLVLAIIFGVIGARTFRSRPHFIEGTLMQLDHDHRRMSGSD